MANKYLLGLDIGSSSVKASLVNVDSGKCVASAFYPEKEAPIMALKAGWAEQNPQMWWDNTKLAVKKVMTDAQVISEDVVAVGISYQMHGLVCIDKKLQVLRPAIIWCDSRAVSYGERAFRDLGEGCCLKHLLNSPGNFTAAKLAWVKENEPDIYHKIYRIMLPGDYIAMRLSGQVNTTVSGLSEGMFWDFKKNRLAQFLLDYYGFDTSLIPDIVPTFGHQSEVSAEAAVELGLKANTPITYRAGDQPNNALSLNVMNPGEIAATAGTSGVVYGVSDEINYDPKSRVNTFAHVNHLMKSKGKEAKDDTRLGILLCINGTGILNSWIHQHITPQVNYDEMNVMASLVPIGSEGLSVLPFGNGAERVLQNREVGCSIHGLNFNKHTEAHLIRAAQEGIVFSFCYGMEIMQQMGMDIKKIHAGRANMFKSPLFRDTLASVSGAVIDVYKTDGADGAAKGAGMGVGIYKDSHEAFASLENFAHIEPDVVQQAEYQSAYGRWKETLEHAIK
ncbi:MAG: carbohydrate kinase [Prevotella sp.]|nr:carbohydrate kinase [Prevotella sp.]